MMDAEGSCGWNLAVTFMLSATFEPDRSCLNKISTIDFNGTTTKTKQIALQYFGTDDVWGVRKSNGSVLSHSSTSELTRSSSSFEIALFLSLLLYRNVH